MSDQMASREQYEHVKNFLIRMEGFIPAVKLKLAVMKVIAQPQFASAYEESTKEIASIIADAWRKAFSRSEKFSSMADFDFMKSVVSSHFTPILVSYGLGEVSADRAMRQFGSIVVSMSHGAADKSWKPKEYSKLLRHHVIPHCGHTENEQMAADNFMTFSSHSAADIGAELSSVTAECVRSIMGEVERNPQIAFSTDGGKLATILLSLRCIELGIAVPTGIMSTIKSINPDLAAEAMFHLPVDFAIHNLEGQPRRQFSEILARASLPPGSDIMFSVQFPTLGEDTMVKIIDAARGGGVHYI